MKSLEKYDFLQGELLLINKPLTWTSFDVVNKIRYALKRLLNIKKIKVGHAGTLDPLATGLLLICTGKMTREIQYLQGLPKTYEGELKLGATTPSYDAETTENNLFTIENITDTQVKATANQFMGKIQQAVPAYSAVKVDGVASYKLARKGHLESPVSREVTIEEFAIEHINLPFVKFRIRCSKGTYIRSLAHDFGIALNNGAYLTALKRTSIGDYHLDNAMELHEFINLIDSSMEK